MVSGANHAIEVPFKGNAIEITGMGGQPFELNQTNDPTLEATFDPAM